MPEAHKFKQRRLGYYGFIFVVAVLAAALVGTLVYWFHMGRSSLPVTGQAANFSGTNVNGKSVSLNKLSGKIRIVTFFYTNCPDECPLTRFREEQLQDRLEQVGEFGKDVVFISVSIDPVHDSVAVIRRWSADAHPNYSGWYFLRIPAKNLPAVLGKYGVQIKKTSDPELLEHTISTQLIDGGGNIRKTYASANLNVNELYNDIQNLLAHRSWG